MGARRLNRGRGTVGTVCMMQLSLVDRLHVVLAVAGELKHEFQSYLYGRKRHQGPPVQQPGGGP